MRVGLGNLVIACISLCNASATAQTAADEETPRIALSVPSGAPLRLYLTKRVSKRTGAPVEAKLLESVFAFDREVIPAGTVAQGQVSRVQPVGKWQRARAIVNGDFTPLRSALLEFTTLIMPDGHTVSTHTVETVGLNSMYFEPFEKAECAAAEPKRRHSRHGQADREGPHPGGHQCARQRDRRHCARPQQEGKTD